MSFKCSRNKPINFLRAVINIITSRHNDFAVKFITSDLTRKSQTYKVLHHVLVFSSTNLILESYNLSHTQQQVKVQKLR